MLGATLSDPITFVEFGFGRLPDLTNPIKLSGRVSTIPESVNWKFKLEVSMKEYTFNRKVNGLRVDVATVYKFDNGKAAYETCTRGYHEVVNPDVAFATVRQWLEDMDDAHRSKHWR